jgi:hypothetical protein
MLVETNDIAQLKALIADLYQQNQQLRTKVADLEARLAKNSANSHKPPSSDGLAKKSLIKPAISKPPGKKQGGQADHQGDTLRMVQAPDRVIAHQASHCYNCGRALTGSGQSIAARQVFDLPPPRLEVTQHQLLAHTCSCGCVSQGQFRLGGGSGAVWPSPESHLTGLEYGLPYPAS